MLANPASRPEGPARLGPLDAPRLRATAAVALAALLLACGAAGAGVVRLLTDSTPFSGLDAALDADGGFTLVWTSAASVVYPFQDRAFLQRFDASGAPASARLTLAELDAASRIFLTRVARGRSGHELVLVGNRSGLDPRSFAVTAQIFDAAGTPLGAPAELASFTGPESAELELDVAATPAGGWVAIWKTAQGEDHRLYSRAIHATSGPGAETLLLVAGEGVLFAHSLGASAERLFLTWSSPNAPGGGARTVLREVDGAGYFQGPEIAYPVIVGDLATEIRSLAGFGADRFLTFGQRQESSGTVSFFGRTFQPPGGWGTPFALPDSASGVAENGIALDSAGRAMWTRRRTATVPPNYSSEIGYQGRALDGEPLMPEFSYAQTPIAGGPTAAVAEDGRWLVAWPHGSANEHGVDAAFGSFADGCQPAATTLCLVGHRFAVRASWRDHLGREGVGQAVRLGSASGAFWFFAPAHLEVLVKAVDACSELAFQDFWVFAAGLTDVAVELTVVDTWTATAWTRSTSLGEPFPPVLDTQAFRTCGAPWPFLH